MKSMDLRGVPDEVYASLAEAAAANRQSLSTFVGDRLAEIAAAARLGAYVDAYPPARGSGITLDDATAAIRRGRGD